MYVYSYIYNLYIDIPLYIIYSINILIYYVIYILYNFFICKKEYILTIYK